MEWTVVTVLVVVVEEVVESSVLPDKPPPSTELAEPAAVVGKVAPEELEVDAPPKNLADALSLSRRPPKKGFCTAIGSPC